MKYGEKALELFNNGYCCSQAVVGAFSDDQWFKDTGLSLETAMKLSSSFGGGIGRSREVCGAVSGMCIIAGLLQGFDNPKDENAATKKKNHYAQIQELLAKFREENGSIICKELLGLTDKTISPAPEARTPEYYKKRPCGEICKIAADIVGEIITNS